MRRLILGLLFVVVGNMGASAQESMSDAEKAKLLKEHTFGGTPTCSSDDLYYRQAYILCFDPDRRVPRWTSYRVIADYRNTPKRVNRFSSFRADPDIDGEARNSDYVGLLASRGYARGHFTPYGVLGGDRDGDTLYAHIDSLQSDIDEEPTVFQGNYMSNIAPQHHAGFNGSPGLWWHLERWLQDDMAREGSEVLTIIAGAIFGSGEVEKVGPSADIHVPPMFYKIAIFHATDTKPQRVLAFLFPHQRVKHGRVQDFLTSINVVEALSGVDFLADINIDEDNDSWHVWLDHFEGQDSSHTR